MKARAAFAIRVFCLVWVVLHLATKATAATATAQPAPPAASSPASPPPPEEEAPDPPPAATDSIARKIIENYVTVTGGAEVLRKTAMVQLAGTGTSVSARAGPPVKFTLWIAPPGRARFETVENLQYGKTKNVIQVVNGKESWTTEPTAARPVVEEGPAAKFSGLAWLANVSSDFLDPDARGLKLKYEGKEKFRGMEALVVKAWPAGGGAPEYLYFDPQKFLLLRIRSDVRVAGNRVTGNIFLTKYENKGGLWLPAELEHALGDTVVGRTSISEIKVLPAADPSLFARPASRERVLRQQNPPAPPTPAPGTAPAGATAPGK